MIVVLLIIVAAVAVQVFGRMLIEITSDIDKENRRKQKEREFQRQLQDSIRKGQRRN